jgi:nucleotide sugar dehydrogenase
VSEQKAMLTELYRPLNLRETPILVTDLESAELIKYASNAFLATKISFINEISSLCESVNADVHAIAKGMGMDARIGPKFLHPGPGYGGSCFPKDTRALLNTALEYGNELKIVSATVEANAAHQEKMVAKIRQAVGGSEAGKKLAVLGLTFKPETDDIRESPALKILPQLVQGGANIVAHDPKGLEAAKRLLPQEMAYRSDLDNVFQAADAIVILTEWNVYRALNLEKIISQMRGRALIDLRNIYKRDAGKKQGFIITV